MFQNQTSSIILFIFMIITINYRGAPILKEIISFLKPGLVILLELSEYFILNVLYGCRRLEQLHLKSAFMLSLGNNKIKKNVLKSIMYLDKHLFTNLSLSSLNSCTVRAKVLSFFYISLL